jgi:hypothetical protein
MKPLMYSILFHDFVDFKWGFCRKINMRGINVVSGVIRYAWGASSNFRSKALPVLFSLKISALSGFFVPDSM